MGTGEITNIKIRVYPDCKSSCSGCGGQSKFYKSKMKVLVRLIFFLKNRECIGSQLHISFSKP